MFIDFEGIDGSGKTTLSNRVAARLRGLGHPVTHAREGGNLASPIAEKIRALTRDVHHLALCETAELLLYAAREAQTLEEVIRPALERGEWVFSDRYVYSHLALARDGRGLGSDGVWKVLEFAAGNVFPDLVIFVDVDPSIARARKRSQKVRDRRLGDSSRKGQGGAGLAARVRQGFLKMAEADPARWVVFDNTWGTLEEAEDALVELVLERARQKDARRKLAPPIEVQRFTPGAVRLGEPPRDEPSIRRSFLTLNDTIAGREPALAAHLLSGLSGADVDERRLRLSRFAPDVVAYGIGGLEDQGSMALRHALKAVEPRYVARSLGGLAGYMFDDQYPLWLRALSLFHLPLVAVLVWMLWRQGYDRRALWAQT
ncbi:MAG: dTMP kinase, partial [Myxococcales bacterium]